MSKEKQYINIIRSNQNIKVDHQVLLNNEVIQSAQSVFLLQDNLFSSDTLFKLQALEQNINPTYISAICESKEQKIIPNKEVKSKDCSYVPFDAVSHIELHNTMIETATLFNNNGNIDYLFSPFTLLYNHMLSHVEANSLNLLIHNDNIYALILNDEKRCVENAIVSITPFNEIKNSEFYNDEVVEQKLYDEIYLLELTDIISNLTKAYYEKFNNTNFIENVNLFYSMKQLSDEQLETLSDELMMEISYKAINLDNIIYDISQRNTATKYSFIEPRSKKTSLSLSTWIIIALLTTLIVITSIFLLDNQDETPAVEQKIEQTSKESPKIIKEITIPDHRMINESTITMIQDLFDTLDEQSVLKEIQIQKDESTMICEFYTLTSQEKFLNDSIKKLYKKSEIVLASESNQTLTTIITNTTLLEPIKSEQKNYVLANNTYLDTIASEKYIQELLGNDVKVIFEEKVNSKYETHIFSLTVLIKEPVHFYKIIEVLSKQSYSITLNYPIEFIKTTNALEVTFTLHFNQNIPEMKN